MENLIKSLFLVQNYAEYIEINPEIRFGKPIIKGTRISVYDILNLISRDDQRRNHRRFHRIIRRKINAPHGAAHHETELE